MKVSLTLDSKLFILLSLAEKNHPLSPLSPVSSKSRYSIHACKKKNVKSEGETSEEWCKGDGAGRRREKGRKAVTWFLINIIKTE